MPNTREKLIELLKDGGVRDFPFVAALADHLIANGVTLAEDNNVPSKWIPVTERLPEEHKSIFAKLHGTKNWMPGMFCTLSNTVLASVEYEDGTRSVKATHTKDGKWNLQNMHRAKEVTHWMPLPEPPKGE
jgi:hypothetical protein